MENKFIYEYFNKYKLGKIQCFHGEIKTPSFVFCGTKGAIKGLDHGEIYENTQILLCNAFHLNDHADRIEKLGGIHKFINWNKPIITDSGGFQIFSLGNGYISDEIKGVKNKKTNYVKVKEEGCFFKNPINGDNMFIGPEQSIKTQIKLGVDFVVSFDECTTYGSGYEYTKKSMHRSHRWEKISLEYFEKNKKNHQSIYGIVQGGIFEDLRDESIDFINKNNYWGIAIGGCLGKTKEDLYNIVKYVSLKLDRSRPVHLLGIGKLEDIINLCEYVDTFDCVEPTRIARHGAAIVKKGKLNLRNSRYLEDFMPISEDCECFTCKNYTRAYISYLFRVHEISGIQMLVRHNIHTMNIFMNELREAMMNNELDKLKDKWI